MEHGRLLLVGVKFVLFPRPVQRGEGLRDRLIQSAEITRQVENLGVPLSGSLPAGGARGKDADSKVNTLMAAARCGAASGSAA